MIIPIRCFSCGKEIANMWEQYLDLITQYEKEEEDLGEATPGSAERRAWAELGVTRYCCKRMMLTHVDMIQKLIELRPSGRFQKGER